MSDEPLVRRVDVDGVATLTLARPGNRNALSLAMLGALGDALAAVEADRAVRVLVLAGEGPAFSAGHDLAELRDADPATASEVFTTCAEVMTALGTLRVPTVAKVAGVATAAGCQLVATCDLAIAGASARFATPGVDIGLFCSTPAVPLVRTVAPKHAMQLLLTGDLVGSDVAFRMGLVNEVVADDELDAVVDALTAKLASKPPEVIAAGKAALRRQAALPLTDAYQVASEAMVEGLGGPDAVEGIGAFLDKRRPVWRG